MRVFLFTVLTSILSFASVKGQNQVRWNQWETIDEKIQKGNRKFLVYLYFDGCKWCKYMEETTLRDDQTAKFINNNFHAFRINALEDGKIVVNGRAYTSLRIGKFDFNELAVEMLAGKMSFPAMVFLDENFNKIVAEEGYTDNDNFGMILSYYAGNHYKKTIWKRYADNYCRDSHFNSLVNTKRK